MKLSMREYNEGELVEYLENIKVEEALCEHVTEEGILPHAIKATNESGYNSTMICLDCLLGELKYLNIIQLIIK